jgi:hypothetical protein
MSVDGFSKKRGLMEGKNPSYECGGSLGLQKAQVLIRWLLNTIIYISFRHTNVMQVKILTVEVIVSDVHQHYNLIMRQI